MTPFQWLVHHSVTGLTRLACVLTLFALGAMVYSVLVPRALPIMLALSVGHLVGGASFLCFFSAVVIDAARSPRRAGGPDSSRNPDSARSG